jgi:hypothetical protein
MLREALGDAAFEQLRAIGARMTLGETVGLIEETLAGLRPAPAPRTAPDRSVDSDP